RRKDDPEKSADWRKEEKRRRRRLEEEGVDTGTKGRRQLRRGEEEGMLVARAKEEKDKKSTTSYLFYCVVDPSFVRRRVLACRPPRRCLRRLVRDPAVITRPIVRVTLRPEETTSAQDSIEEGDGLGR
ncbi:hypothetical protein BHM03_00016399, partial [Ensete ventricosum]